MSGLGQPAGFILLRVTVPRWIAKLPYLVFIALGILTLTVSGCGGGAPASTATTNAILQSLNQHSEAANSRMLVAGAQEK